MNKINQKVKENINLKKLSKSFKFKDNSLRIPKKGGEHFDHLLAKFLSCVYLRNNGHKIVTEHPFKDGTRADIYSYSHDIAYEVVWSEKDESIELKKELYPCEVRKIDARVLLGLEFEEYYKVFE